MANKFQKSVRERLEQEAARQQTAAPEERIPAPDPHSGTVHTAEEGGASARGIPAHSLAEIGSYLRRVPQRRAKNKTFYLDTDVIEAVHAAAHRENITDSGLVNDILRHVLGV